MPFDILSTFYAYYSRNAFGNCTFFSAFGATVCLYGRRVRVYIHRPFFSPFFQLFFWSHLRQIQFPLFLGVTEEPERVPEAGQKINVFSNRCLFFIFIFFSHRFRFIYFFGQTIFFFNTPERWLNV